MRGPRFRLLALAETSDAHVGADAVRRHAGRTVLMVGHGNTIPAIITALGGPKLADLCDAQYSMLFTLVIWRRTSAAHAGHVWGPAAARRRKLRQHGALTTIAPLGAHRL